MTWTSEQHEAAMDLVQLFGVGCPCCGEPTKYNPKTYRDGFKPGHDARLVSRIAKLCRDTGSALTWGDAEQMLDYEGFPKLAHKLTGMRLHLPKNGPTRKAARALVEEVDGSAGKRFIERTCGSLNPDGHKWHDTSEDCGISLHLLGETRSSILRRFA